MTKSLIRILIVDDDLVDRLACRRTLTQCLNYNFVLTEAETGEEGLQFVRAQKPDCILLDYHMPDMNGLEFLKELAAEIGEIPVPVMMLTGADSASVAVEAMKRGAWDYMVKDVEREYLKLLPTVIQRVLREKEMRTEKKLIEDKLLQVEAKYRNLVEQIPAITYIAALDETNQALYISPQIKVLGFSPAQWLETPGIHIAQIHPEDRTRVLNELIKSRANGTPLRCEYRLISRNETVFWFRDEASVVRDESGRSLFLQGILVDITESKQVEAELRQHRWRLEELVAKRTDELAEVNKHLRQDIVERKRVQAELVNAKAVAEKANLTKSNFLSSMSHELRTPLNAILGFAQLIEIGTPTPTPTQMARLKEILHGGWYLLELINEILDLATIESGNLVLSLESVSLAEVISECQAMIEPQAQQHGIQLIFPKFDSPLTVKADRTRLKQALINLLSNAIKYNREQGTVEVKCVRGTSEYVRISVQDTGEGLSPEKLTQLFQPFNRLGQENGAVEGTGIGLAVTKQVLELMGGVIRVDSTVGVGSVFWFELISATEPQLVLEECKSQELTAKTYADTQQYCILYFEDNSINSSLIKELIEENRPDIHLLIAGNGNLGIELARIHLPDVILMDVTLPDMNGIQAMEILFQDPLTASIPIVALSADAMPHHILKGMEAGFFRYICKPFELNEFMFVIDEALEFRTSRLTTGTSKTKEIEG
ncbi:Histidine kinase [Candidatus Nitrotoga sp. HW29]|uniref:response regulator n=1 Tax=Candidatus Nitrotoga sp. HW29 TaxID=2886963 RepID=UPI001EF22EA0|nr:response regulator [Candidatus Nitrotoga sp. HW29]CAH1904049.1 Histidine kinase [Candidatus Nitrotoga sp. HW29]